MSAAIDADVVVVGGSVAGATTARLLAEAGHQVVVLDKAQFPRDKPCGEGVMPTGVRLLDRLGVLRQIPGGQGHTIRGVEFVVNDGARIRGDFPDVGGGFNRGMGIRRLVLDHVLLKHARAHLGVKVHESEAALDVAWPAGLLAEVSTTKRRYRARIVIGADGLRSMVRRKLGLEMRRRGVRRYGVRAHFHFTDSSRIGDYVTVFRDAGAESYLTPVGDTELEVALLLEHGRMKAFSGRLAAEYDSYLDRMPHLRSMLEGSRRISPVLACGSFNVWARSRVADRALLVGDAGGYLDPITGEGISLALQSAYWAADIVDKGLRRDDLSAGFLRPYHDRIEQAIRHYKILTRALLMLKPHARLAAMVVQRLGHCPELYSTLLGVNCGARSFRDIRPTDLWRFVQGGRAP